VKKRFSKFPKQRPILPDAYQKIYAKEYEGNREGGTIINKIVGHLEAWMHLQIVQNKRSVKNESVLEIGAGTLNHLKYENINGHYDIIEPMEFLFENKKEVPLINTIFRSIEEIDAQDEYDRILSIAVLEHLCNLPRVIAKSAVLLKPNGQFQAGIPREGGFLWGLAWRSTTGLSYRLRNGLDYGVLMRHEHVNDAEEIREIINYFYEDVTVTRFPLSHPHLSFYEYIEAATPAKILAANFLKQQ